MNNEQAIETLDELTELATRTALASVWARAFLTEGGEATWDAVKDVSALAEDLHLVTQKVAEFATRYEEITS